MKTSSTIGLYQMNEECNPAFLADVRSRAKSPKKYFVSFEAFDSSLVRKKRDD